MRARWRIMGLVTAGLGGMGGAQPLAATMNGGSCLVAEIDPARIDFRLRTAYVDESTGDIDAAIDKALEWKSQGVARSMGVCCNATELLARMIERKVVPDILTDQTSAHDPLDGYVPDGMTHEQALACSLERVVIVRVGRQPRQHRRSLRAR